MAVGRGCGRVLERIDSWGRPALLSFSLRLIFSDLITMSCQGEEKVGAPTPDSLLIGDLDKKKISANECHWPVNGNTAILHETRTMEKVRDVDPQKSR